jgi:RND family efflux transporter MFP subunit
LETNQRELKRIQTLVAEGALAGNRLDQQQNLVDTAQAQYDSALQSFNLIQVGNRPEDISAAREAVRTAQEGVRNAQEQKQLDPLLKDQIDAAKAQVGSAHAQLTSARAQVAIAKQALNDAQIVAPFDGKVMGRPIQAGTIAGNGTAIVRLIGESGIYLSGQLQADQVSQVRSGMPASVSTDAIPGKTFDGTVAAISPQADTVGRLFNVRIQLSSAPEIKPGMFAKARITVETISEATVVPDQAILHEGDLSYVFIVTDNVAKRLQVTTGLQQGSLTQVSGVPIGSSVIIAGHETLNPGAKVRIQPLGTQAKGIPTSLEG